MEVWQIVINMNMVVAGPEAYNALLKRVQLDCAEIENADAVGIAVQLGRKFRQTVFAQMVSSLPHKIGFIADYEGRSVNSHILVLVRENIREFEAQHGKIEGEISPDVNVKPTAKLSGKKEAD